METRKNFTGVKLELLVDGGDRFFEAKYEAYEGCVVIKGEESGSSDEIWVNETSFNSFIDDLMDLRDAMNKLNVKTWKVENKLK